MSDPTESATRRDEVPLAPTARTRVSRVQERAGTDREALYALLDEALLAHVGIIRDGYPVVIPTTYAVDRQGPDQGGTLYLHGSVAAGWLTDAVDADVCVSVTLLDGLVLARSGFHHSMNYRSAVVLGRARLVTDPGERARALGLIVDHVVPGRVATLRPDTRKELAATIVLAVPLHEASVKARAGGPKDDPEDVAAGTWAGHLPLRLVAGDLVTDPETSADPPADVTARAAALAHPAGPAGVPDAGR